MALDAIREPLNDHDLLSVIVNRYDSALRAFGIYVAKYNFSDTQLNVSKGRLSKALRRLPTFQSGATQEQHHHNNSKRTDDHNIVHS